MASKEASLVSAQELHSFGNFLKRSEDDMKSLIINVNREVSRTNEAWDDKVNRQFTDKFYTYIDHVVKLVELLDDYSKFVHAKADAIENYGNVGQHYI